MQLERGQRKQVKRIIIIIIKKLYGNNNVNKCSHRFKKKKKTFDISDILWGQKKKRKKMK